MLYLPLRAPLVLGISALGSVGLVLLGRSVTAPSVAAAARLARPEPGDAATLLLGVAGAGLLGAGAWLGLVSLVGVADLARCAPASRTSVVRPGWVRTAVVRACAPTLGAAVICAGSPVAADPGGAGAPPTTPAAPAARNPVHGLTGLALPTRPVSQSPVPPSIQPPQSQTRVRVVRPGECLWSITRDLLGERASVGQVTDGWQRVYRLNRDRVGPDPDVVHPGTALRVPAPLTDHQHPSR